MENIFSFRTNKEEIRAFYSQLNAANMSQTTQNVSMPVIWETETYAYIYGAIIVIFFVITLARSIVSFQLSASASQNLHDNMFKGLISTSMRFFDLNPSDHIMNRFSRDMGSVDEALPRAILDAAQTNLNMIGAILVTSFVSLKLTVITMIMFVLFILLRKVYIKSSMNIKRFETMSKF